MKTEKISAQVVMAALVKKSKPLINKVSSLEVKTADDYSTAAQLLSNLKELAKAAEADKAKMADPLKQSLKAIDAHFKPFAEQVKQIEADTKAKMLLFIEANERKANKLLEDFEAGKIKKLETVVEKQAQLKDLDNSNATLRKVKEVEIFAPKKIPAKYLMPNTALIKEDLIKGKKVDGCRLVLKNSLAI